MINENQNESQRMKLLHEQYAQYENELSILYGRREILNKTIEHHEQLMHGLRGAIQERLITENEKI